jgi:hypothetical protein
VLRRPIETTAPTEQVESHGGSWNDAQKQLFVGIEIRDFRLSRISHLGSGSKWGFWAARTKSVVASALATQNRTPVDREQSRSLPTSRHPGTNLPSKNALAIWLALHAKNPISSPTATPAKPRKRPCFKTTFVTLRGSAPSAILWTASQSRTRRLRYPSLDAKTRVYLSPAPH